MKRVHRACLSLKHGDSRWLGDSLVHAVLLCAIVFTFLIVAFPATARLYEISQIAVHSEPEPDPDPEPDEPQHIDHVGIDSDEIAGFSEADASANQLHRIPKHIYIIHKFDLCDVTQPSYEQQHIFREEPYYFQLLTNVQKIKALNPDFNVTCFDDDSAFEYMLVTRNAPRFAAYFKNETHGMFKADLFRGFLLFFEGGYYYDSDMEPRMPLSRVLEDDTSFSSCISTTEFSADSIFQSYLGATQYNPILKQNLLLWNSYYANGMLFAGNNAKIPGPVLMRDALVQYANESSLQAIQQQRRYGNQTIQLFQEKPFEGEDAAVILKKRYIGTADDDMFKFAIYDNRTGAYPFWCRFTGYFNADMRAWARKKKKKTLHLKKNKFLQPYPGAVDTA